MTRRMVKIAWLYGSRMNMYGDRGNIVALSRRAGWRDIDVSLVDVDLGQAIPDDADIFFFGGGQDQAQAAVAKDLSGAKADAIRAGVEDGAALLAICGGYQLLGNEYRPHAAEPLSGVGLFDIVSSAGPDRMIGNIVIDSRWGQLVGFENHSGVTILGSGVEPLGTVRAGYGNNGRDKTEGAIYRNAIGCYLHGSLLPKNPVLADWILEMGLLHRYGEANLSALDDRLEQSAQANAIARAAAVH